jgi:hypothetical protein
VALVVESDDAPADAPAQDELIEREPAG